MNKADILYKFIRKIERAKLLTKFISCLFDYDNLHDYNYLFRITKQAQKVIIDIYDNISQNRFNRYIFDFSHSHCNSNMKREGAVFLTYINVNKTKNAPNKLYKLAYLMNLSMKQMSEYASTFLDDDMVNILNKTIKK